MIRLSVGLDVLDSFSNVRLGLFSVVIVCLSLHSLVWYFDLIGSSSMAITLNIEFLLHPILSTVSFGPAHPAAHGVFRLIVEMESEVIVCSDSCLGLLFRATEQMVESRTVELVSGYYARLDYVSHLVLEFGFNLSSIDFSPHLTYLLNSVLIANHLLNLSCTLADAGMVSAILWSFEIREVLAESIDVCFGSRLHCNFAVTSFYAIGASVFDCDLGIWTCKCFDWVSVGNQDCLPEVEGKSNRQLPFSKDRLGFRCVVFIVWLS